MHCKSSSWGLSKLTDVPGSTQPAHLETFSGPLRVWRGGAGPQLDSLTGLVHASSAGPADMPMGDLELSRTLAPAGTQVVAAPARVWCPGQSHETVAATITLYGQFLRGT